MPFWSKLDLTDPLVREGMRHIPPDYDYLMRMPDGNISKLLYEVALLDARTDRIEKDLSGAVLEVITKELKKSHAVAMRQLYPIGNFAKTVSAVHSLLFDKYQESLHEDNESVHDFPDENAPDIADVSTVNWNAEFANHDYRYHPELLSEAVFLKMKPSVIRVLFPNYKNSMLRIADNRRDKNQITQQTWRVIMDNISEAHQEAFENSVKSLINQGVKFTLSDFIMTKQLEFVTGMLGDHVMESLDQFQP